MPASYISLRVALMSASILRGSGVSSIKLGDPVHRARLSAAEA